MSRIYIAGPVTGLPDLRRMSKCLLCNLDSGPWLTTQAAEVSGLLHITGHHACMVSEAR